MYGEAEIRRTRPRNLDNNNQTSIIHNDTNVGISVSAFTAVWSGWTPWKLD